MVFLLLVIWFFFFWSNGLFPSGYMVLFLLVERFPVKWSFFFWSYGFVSSGHGLFSSGHGLVSSGDGLFSSGHGPFSSPDDRLLQRPLPSGPVGPGSPDAPNRTGAQISHGVLPGSTQNSFGCVGTSWCRYVGT